jgi:hypothetical protein
MAESEQERLERERQERKYVERMVREVQLGVSGSRWTS